MIGQRIHSYEVNAHLGQGGMGNVFRATDSMLGREVALKMLHPELTIQPQFLERFKKEARVLAQLLHPNIAVIYNFIEQGGNHFMVMEYVEGTSLDDLLKKYRVLPAAFVVPVFLQALEGLQHAHRKNIFHRDIKPANLMLTHEAMLKLMDFGIAKVAGEQKMTQVNKIVGTIEFMAPELIEGKDASAASDIYSMGVTLYELVTGKIPFEGDTDFNMMQAILKAKPKAPDKINPQVPKALNDIILKAMDKDPEKRFLNARAFEQALITAFPAYREIDVNVLRKAQESIRAEKQTGSFDNRSGNWETNSSSETRVELARPLSFLGNYKEKILAHKRIVLAILALLFLFLAIFTITTIRRTGSDETADHTKDSLALAEAAYKNPTGDPQPGQEASRRTNLIQEPDYTRTSIPEPEPEPGAEKKIVLPKEEKTIVKEKKKEAKSPGKKTVEVSEPVETPVAANPEPKTILINSEVKISLALTSSPEMNQKQKEAQRVTFSVTKPVYYNGTLIIRQGATATGTITIGRVMTDIEINAVEAANGKNISLKAEKAHGKRSDIESGKTYNAIVQTGTKLTFR